MFKISVPFWIQCSININLDHWTFLCLTIAVMSKFPNYSLYLEYTQSFHPVHWNPRNTVTVARSDNYIM